jgi:hypothetical protein
MSRSSPPPSGWPRRLAAPGGSLLLALIGLALALGCQGGSDPATPPQQVPAQDTWVSATALLLDAGAPGGPEFFDCETLLGIDPGLEWSVEAGVATSGVTGGLGSANPRVEITATDESGRTGVGLVLTLDPATMTATVPAGNAQLWFFDTDLACPAVNGRQPSRFEGVAGTVAVAITEMATSAGQLVVAAPVDGLGRFSPEGILAGTFAFEATNRQESPVGALTARLTVTGCFRVNVPAVEQGVPVLAAPCP